MHIEPQDIRGDYDNENLAELIEASSSVGAALNKGQQQYQTPDWFARGLVAQLPRIRPTLVLDPQCAGGHLLRAFGRVNHPLGWEIDKRFADLSDDVVRIRGNCVKLAAIWEEIYPARKFPCIVANPPFGMSWKTADEEATIDSTQWTWDFITRNLADHGFGFMIANKPTIERLGIHEHPAVYAYQTFPGGLWDNTRVEIGVVHFVKWTDSRPWSERFVRHWTEIPGETELGCALVPPRVFPPAFYLYSEWENLRKIYNEEHGSGRHRHNIYLTEKGILRTYLSTRSSLKLTREQVYTLNRIQDAHPLALTTERETRKLLMEVITAGIYTIEPEALQAIQDALAAVESAACPIMKPTEFELAAYNDERDGTKCISLDPQGHIALTVGKLYEIKTGTYEFKEKYYRNVLQGGDDENERATVESHECVLIGQDRFVQITDDRGRVHRFMERPRPPKDDPRYARYLEHSDTRLFDLFDKPEVPSVSDLMVAEYNANIASLKMNGLVNSFDYFPGQIEYMARMLCKDSGVIAADVGTGKTLFALTLTAIKAPRRTLIIAPQGTMRSTGEEEGEDYEASQWVQEIARFAPSEPVFQLFSEADWRTILKRNGGKAPPGIYISYPAAMFQNGAFELLPHSWSERDVEEKFCKHFGFPYDKERTGEDLLSRSLGNHNDNGIRCIMKPSLATIVATEMGEWDMVIVDEAHLIAHLESNVTKNLLRLQPKQRWLMTATPIPNIISNIFPLMGWVCVDDWYLGNRRNVAWPYAVNEEARFSSTFLAIEVDITAQQKARMAGKKSWRSAGVKKSPLISSPARLLKLLKPSMAYISKEDCNPDLVPCEVVDVRVPMGQEQTVLYNYWMDRANYRAEYKNALTIAMVQPSRLRGVCAAPASVDYNKIPTVVATPEGYKTKYTVPCRSNFNPKTMAILQLVQHCLSRGEQCVVVNARVGQSSEVARRLQEAKVSIARIDSTVTADRHSAEAAKFKRGDAQVMLMGIKCAQGHSFDQCPNLIIGSLEWTYGSLHQAKGRVWRLTSKKPVKVWCVLHSGSFEEVLFDRVAMKQDAATICLHGKRVPRDFKSADIGELLADHVDSFREVVGKPESDCETEWATLRKSIKQAAAHQRASLGVGSRRPANIRNPRS